MSVPTVDVDARDRRQHERGYLPPKSDDAEEQRGVREAIDQPARGDASDPRPDKRNALSAEEESVVSMRERASQSGACGRGHLLYCKHISYQLGYEGKNRRAISAELNSFRYASMTEQRNSSLRRGEMGSARSSFRTSALPRMTE